SEPLARRELQENWLGGVLEAGGGKLEAGKRGPGGEWRGLAGVGLPEVEETGAEKDWLGG
ncbi:MAG: hypothetical protein ACE5MH_07095, partial [Terriglobia bacterium]